MPPREPRYASFGSLVDTAPDYDDALRFYRDVSGLRERLAYSSSDGRVSILEAGRPTLELTDPAHAAYIDEVDVGRRVAATFESPSRSTTPLRLQRHSRLRWRPVVAEPTRTPWNALTARLEATAGLQLTLFTELA